MDFAFHRAQMVRRHLRSRGIRDPRVLAAMGKVEREALLPAELGEFAYDDTPLPIAAGQTISQPYIVALMTEALRLSPGDRVLEIGTGSGYAAAVLAEIAAKVYTIERHAELADSARRQLVELGYQNIEVRCGDGTLGWAEHAPFDAIAVAANTSGPGDRGRTPGRPSSRAPPWGRSWTMITGLLHSWISRAAMPPYRSLGSPVLPWAAIITRSTFSRSAKAQIARVRRGDITTRT